MNPNPLNIKLRNAMRIDRALKFVWEASALYSVLSGLIMVISGILPLVMLYLIKLIIDSVTGLALEPGGAITDPKFSNTLIYIGMACVTGLLTAFFNFLGDHVKKAQTLTVSDHMFCVLHEKAVLADLAFYESPRYHDTLFRARQEGPSRPASIVNGLFTAGRSAASYIAVFWLLAGFNPVLPVIMTCACVPGILMRLKYSNKIYSWQEKRTEDERRAYYFHWMLTGDTHAGEFRLFNLGSYFISGFNAIRKTLKKEKLYFEKRRAFGDFTAQSSMTIAVFASFVYIAFKTASGMITIGDMVMYFQAFQRGLGYLKTLLESAAQMYEDNLFLSHVYEFLKIRPSIKSPRFPVQVPEKIRTGIEFRNVKFYYQNNEKNVINDVNFSIRPGEIVALVGENGSGKSTIVKLLARLYDPGDGAVFLDGENIRNFNPDEFRKKISIVFQDHIHYQLSAKENIFLGNLARKNDESGIRQAAHKTGVDRKISEFKNGYDTILGRWFKNGEELSTGQWQMMAISRAFFRDAEIIILDEPSSSLDPETETAVFEKLKKLIQGRSALIISHRYSTVKMADTILVLHKGRIVEKGSHTDLMKQDGRYAQMYRMQAQAYN
jgi:ATP-binding cassette subfamily B protein